MAKFKNNKPGILGLSFKGDTEARTVNPNEVFEAERDAIPKHYFDQGWIVEATDADIKGTATAGDNPQADAKLNPKFDGPNPTQGSGTSVNQSVTDADAQKSGTYNRGADGTKDNPNTDVKGTSGGTNPSDTPSQDHSTTKRR